MPAKPKIARKPKSPARPLRGKKADPIDTLIAASAQAWRCRSIRPGTLHQVQSSIDPRHAARVDDFCFPTRPNPRRCSVLETAGTDFAWSTAAEIAAAIAPAAPAHGTSLKQRSPAFARGPAAHSFTAVTEQRALLRAQALDDACAQGARLPPLAGVPFAVKNLFDVAGLPTLAGAKINRDAPPAHATRR